MSWSFSLNSEGSLFNQTICWCHLYSYNIHSFFFVAIVPNYGSEVYGEDSICVEVNSTLGDCLPLGGTPRCYQRRVVQQPTTDQMAFAINVGGKQNMFTRSKQTNTTTTSTSTTSAEHICTLLINNVYSHIGLMLLYNRTEVHLSLVGYIS